jgi:hypothetical protein
MLNYISQQIVKELVKNIKQTNHQKDLLENIKQTNHQKDLGRKIKQAVDQQDLEALSATVRFIDNWDELNKTKITINEIDSSLNPVLYAAFKEYREAVVILLKHGANADNANINSNSFLYMMLNSRLLHHETVEKLIKIANGVSQKKEDDTPDSSTWGMLKAQQYIDDLLEGKQPSVINLAPEAEEIVLARVENRLSKLLESGKIVQTINSIKATLEGLRDYHPIADKVLAKLDEFVEYTVLDKDAEVARSIGLSFTESLKDIMKFASYQGDGTYEICEKLLKAYANHKDEPSVIEQLDKLKTSFESYLSFKKYYFASHSEHNLSEIPKEMQPLINDLFSDLLGLEGMYDLHEEFDKVPLLEESLLFYSLNPYYQIPGSLVDNVKAEGTFDLT